MALPTRASGKLIRCNYFMAPMCIVALIICCLVKDQSEFRDTYGAIDQFGVGF